MMKNVEKKVLRGPSFSLTPAEWRQKRSGWGGSKRKLGEGIEGEEEEETVVDM